MFLHKHVSWKGEEEKKKKKNVEGSCMTQLLELFSAIRPLRCFSMYLSENFGPPLVEGNSEPIFSYTIDAPS